MKALLLPLFFLGLLLPVNAADKADPGPVALVQKLYAAHDANQGPFADGITLAGLEKWFSPGLSAVLLKALSNHDEPIIDFDPLYYAQDMEITALKVTEEVNEDGAAACVLVSFKNFGKPTTLRLHLFNAEKGWRVTNIIYATSDLRTIVEE